MARISGICVVVPLLLLFAVATEATFSAGFHHGVASGDPFSDSLVLWTRVTPRPSAANLVQGLSNSIGNGLTLPSTALTYNVTWTVYNGTSNTAVVNGTKLATADTDWTVKVVASGLSPGVNYTFDFNVGSVYSPRGRFRLPQPRGVAQNSLKYFVFSCSNWGFGYFNAYDVASRYDLDFWVHEGDWLYEYGVQTYPSPEEAGRYEPSPFGLQPEHEIETLADYRQRHALYRRDPGLQALSAQAPLLSLWDDHEFFNNVYELGGENQNVGDEPVALRKLAAATAYREWMPIRDAAMGDSIYAINRTFYFGDLATLWMLEDRATVRTNAGQNVPAGTPGALPNIFTTVSNIVSSQDPSTWNANASLVANITSFKRLLDTARTAANQTQLGTAQLAWINQTTREAVNASVWQLYHQGTIMQDWFYADPETAVAVKNTSDAATAGVWASVLANLTGNVPNATYTQWSPVAYAAANFSKAFPVTAALKSTQRANLAVGRWSVNFNTDSWQGYLADRNRFLDAIEPSFNAIVYAGDSHNFWAGYLYKVPLSAYFNTTDPIDPTSYPVYAVEFDTGSVTSTGFADSDVQPYPLDFLTASWLAGNPNMFDIDLRYRGGIYVELTPSNHHAENIYVNTIASTNYTAFCGSAWDVAALTAASRGDQEAVPSTCRPIPAGTPYSRAPTATVSQPRVTPNSMTALANGAYPQLGPNLPPANQSSLLGSGVLVAG